MRQPRRRIFGDHDVVAMLVGLARGGFDAHIGGDPGEHHRFDVPAPQLHIEIGAVERAPLMFRHENVGRVSEFFDELAEVRWKAPFRTRKRTVHWLFQHITEVRREGDVDQYDRCPGSPETRC
jgi:hypothetical protein